MSGFLTPAIILRRIDHGDYDVIISFLTPKMGKITVIAKHAKKSVKRFAGTLELFSAIDAVCIKGKGRMPLLKEASLENSFFNIRSNITKTAYASYWAEIINHWLEEGKEQTQIYYLLKDMLESLDTEEVTGEHASIFFQVRFLKVSGLSPNLSECRICKTELESIKGDRLDVDIAEGGIVCGACGKFSSKSKQLSKGTVKQLLWISRGNFKTAKRVRFSSNALKEGLAFLEKFISYHLGKEPKSLKFLRGIRDFSN